VIDPDHPSIFNIARAHLSKYEKQVLSKGLKFCPTPSPPPPATYDIAIADLYRKLMLKGYFSDNQVDQIDETVDAEKALHNKYKPPSTWIPQKEVLPVIRYFATEIKAALTELPNQTGKNKNNLTRKQREIGRASCRERV
jgi:hypothetical protein